MEYLQLSELRERTAAATSKQELKNLMEVMQIKKHEAMDMIRREDDRAVRAAITDERYDMCQLEKVVLAKLTKVVRKEKQITQR